MKAAFRPLTAHRATSQEMARLYQLGAGLLACIALSLIGVPLVFDQAHRIVSAYIAPIEPSNQIVFLDVDSGLSFSSETLAERQAEAVRIVDKAGPERILIDGKFDSSDIGIADLGKAIAEAKAPITIAWPTEYRSGEPTAARRASFPGVEEVVDSNFLQWNAFVTEGMSPVRVGSRTWTSFPAAIAGVERQPGKFAIDYRYQASSIPLYTLAELADHPDRIDKLAGKRVVVSSNTSTVDDGVFIPKRIRAPTVVLALIAAETLIGGGPSVVRSYISLALACLLIYLTSLLPRGPRRAIYAAAFTTAVALPYLAIPFGVIVETGQAIVLFLIYFTFRLRNSWKHRAAGIERLSGLPNFNALEEDYDASKGRLIVAQVQNYEEILASLEPSKHAAFVHQIAQRLTVGGPQKIYTDTSGHFAWFDDLEHAKSHVSGLLALTSSPIIVDDRMLDFACSFGLLDCQIDKPRQAISSTSVAAIQASERPTRIAYVSEQEGSDSAWQLSLLATLDQAIAKEQLYLVFQGQHSIATGELVGAEALVRWRHPTRGVISPAQFIPQIERAGRLKPLTAHTLRLAARSASSLASSGIKVSVNVSAKLVSDDDFASFVRENVLQAGGRPSEIIIEITETARIGDLDRASRNLDRLQKDGFEIALDDFGTGEANLSLLVYLPCDELKIDRSFVVLAQHSERARMVIGALCRTAKLSKMRLVAEGIETEEDRASLLSLGAEIGQGYLFGKPQLLSQFISSFDLQADPAMDKLRLY